MWLVLIGLLLGASPALAQGPLPDAFYGDWRGMELTTREGGGDVEVIPDDLNFRIQPDGNGFLMQWTGLTFDGDQGRLTRQHIEARFEPSDRPGVFTFKPEQSSLLLGLFGDPATHNPLEGEPLLWARYDDGTLSVYGIAIDDDGGFDLYQHVRSVTGNNMTVRQVHRTELELMILEGRLQQDGG